MLLAGCDRHASATGSSLPLAESIPGDGTIVGRVTIIGTPPAIDSQAQTPGSPQLVVIGKNNALVNAIVSLQGAPSSNGEHEPAVSFDQQNFQFVPHVVAVQIGQPLRISNHDQCMHTVDMDSESNSPRNLSFNGPGDQTITLDSPETFKVHCDIHPNMSAWIAVEPNPYFAVTGRDGSFVIHHVPAGSFTLSVWHELLGIQQQSVEMKPGQTVHVNFAYKP